MKNLIYTFFISAFVLVPVFAEEAPGVSVASAFALLRSGQFEEAVAILTPLHESGDPEAPRLLGLMHIRGDGFERNMEAGREYLRLASNRGNPEASFQLANSYREEDDRQYARYQEQAAQQGHLIAAQQIGRAYYFGVGVEQDDISAYRWLFSIQLRTPVAVETWTEPLEKLNARMTEADKEEAMILAWNYVYRDLKAGWSQLEFDEDNPSQLGPIRKGNYRIINGSLLIVDPGDLDPIESD